MGLKLTFIERQMFEMLVETPGKLVSRERLSWAKPKPILHKSNAIDVHVKNLRKKLAQEGYEIVSVRHEGYKLRKIV